MSAAATGAVRRRLQPARRPGSGMRLARSSASADGAHVSTTAEHLVVFTPSGRRGRFEDGTTVLEAARRLGVDIDSVCGGRGICGRCQVEVSEGEHAKHAIVSAASHLTPISDVEQAYAADRGLAHGPAPRLHRARRRRARDRRAAREPGAPPGRAQGGRRSPDRGRTRSSGSTTSRSRSRISPPRRAISGVCAMHSSASGS